MTTQQEALAAYFQAQQKKASDDEQELVGLQCLFLAVGLRKLFRELGAWLHNKGEQTIRPDEVLAVLEQIRALSGPYKRTLASAIAVACGDAAVRSVESTHVMLTIGGAVDGITRPDFPAKYFEDTFHSIPVGGNLLQEWCNRAFDSLSIDKIKLEIEKGLSEFRSYQQVARALRETIPGTSSQIDTLTRTYMHTATTEGTLAVYRANSDIVTKIQWNAANEETTCIACAWLDGQRFPLDNPPPCPNHPRCRCCLTPVTDGNKYVDVSIPSIQQAARVPDTQTWFEQSDKRLESLVGPNRFALLKAGKVQFDDLVDPGTFKIKPLETLLPGQDTRKIIADLKDKGD